MKLPKEFKGTVYFYWDTKYEYMTVSHRLFNEDGEYLLLGKIEDVQISFDLTHDNAVKQVVKGLQSQKKKIQAEAQRDLNKIDEQLNSLLAITHQSEVL